MANNEHDIDDLYRKVIGEFSETPPDGLWDDVKKDIGSGNRDRFAWWKWLPLLLLLLGGLAFYAAKSYRNNSALENEKNKITIDSTAAGNKSATNTGTPQQQDTAPTINSPSKPISEKSTNQGSSLPSSARQGAKNSPYNTLSSTSNGENNGQSVRRAHRSIAFYAGHSKTAGKNSLPVNDRTGNDTSADNQQESAMPAAVGNQANAANNNGKNKRIATTTRAGTSGSGKRERKGNDANTTATSGKTGSDLKETKAPKQVAPVANQGSKKEHADKPGENPDEDAGNAVAKAGKGKTKKEKPVKDGAANDGAENAVVKAATTDNKKQERVVAGPKTKESAAKPDHIMPSSGTIAKASAVEPGVPARNEPVLKNNETKTPAVIEKQLVAAGKENIKQDAAREHGEAIKDTGTVADSTAKPVKKKLKINLESGAKVGYAFGTSQFLHADKVTIAPYVKLHLSNKLSVSLAPAYKFGSVNNTTLTGPKGSYYRVTDTSITTVVKIDSTGNRYTYHSKQGYDSITVKYAISKKVWEVDLPLTIGYQVLKNLNIYGGPVFTFGGQYKVSTDRTSIHITLNDSVVLSPVRIPDSTLYKRFQHSAQPISALDTSAYANTTPSSLRIGYVAGLNYSFKRFLLDVSIQQSLSGFGSITNQEIKQAYKQPYIHVGIGYQITGNRKKKK